MSIHRGQLFCPLIFTAIHGRCVTPGQVAAVLVVPTVGTAVLSPHRQPWRTAAQDEPQLLARLEPGHPKLPDWTSAYDSEATRHRADAQFTTKPALHNGAHHQRPRICY